MDHADLEQKRRRALQRFGVLDTAPERVFDSITLAIANICEVPIALISLVDEDRQWFKSALGLQVRQTPRDVAFCSHAITRPDELMVVRDASEDARFESNPLVTDDPHIRFYAGKPIVTDDGYALGTLCVIDRKKRELLPHQAEALSALSSTVSAILEERLRLQKVAVDRDCLEEALHQNIAKYQHLYGDVEAMLRGLLERLPTASVVLNRDATIVNCNRAWTQLVSDTGWRSAAIGDKYLSYVEPAPAADADIRKIRRGVQRVLNGSVDRFEITLPSRSGPVTVGAEPLANPVNGVLLQHSLSVPNQST